MANRAVRHMLGLAAWVLATVALACPAAAGPNDVVLVITNEDYRGSVPKVEFARRDGEAFIKAMRELAGVPPSRIVHIGGPSGASRGDFQDYFSVDNRRLADLAAAIRPDTSIYLFYSGHGLAGTHPGTGEPALFLVPVDGDTASPADRGNALPDIEAALSGVLAKRGSSGRVFLFLDTCFGGTSAGGAVAKDTRMVGDVVENVKAKAPPRVVRFAAATGKQLARPDKAEQHGLFTDALIEGLYALQRTGQKSPTAGALQAFIDAQVERRLGDLFPDQSFSQTPTLVGDTGAVVISLSDEQHERDPARTLREATRCRTLARSDDPTEILQFLSSCRTCRDVCRAELGKRASDVRRSGTVCREEGRELARIAEKGAAGRTGLVVLTKEAECVSVRAEASAILGELDAEERRKAAAAEAAAAARRKAAQCATERKLFEDVRPAGRGRLRMLAPTLQCPEVASDVGAEIARLDAIAEEAEAHENNAQEKKAMVLGYIEKAPLDPATNARRFWNHNGSLMKLVADGELRRFQYHVPRPGIIDEGVTPGDLLFEGRRSGLTYSGTAYVFSRRCGRIAYAVSGHVADDERRVTMRGQAPRLASNCRIIGYRPDELVFELE